MDFVFQMDIIGFGSLPIVLLTGFFAGAVLALQTYKTLSTFGEVSLVGQVVGQVVALSLVREMGPVMTALMVAGRNASGPDWVGCSSRFADGSAAAPQT